MATVGNKIDPLAGRIDSSYVVSLTTANDLSGDIITTTTDVADSTGIMPDYDYATTVALRSAAVPPTEKVDKPGKVKVQDIEIEDAVKQLGREAEEVLGYTGLSSQVKKVEGRKPLLDVLRKLDIELLNHAAVSKYKNSKVDYPNTGSFWGSVEISKAESPIPEYALLKAVQIKKEMPAVKFYVESLQADPDPFLYAEYNGERYYIEVWDEPEFEHPGLK